MAVVVGRGQGGNVSTSVTFANMAAPGATSAEAPVAGTYTPQAGDLLVVACWVLRDTPPVPPASATGLGPYRVVASGGGNGVGLTVAVTKVTGAVGANTGAWSPTPIANVDVVALRDADDVAAASAVLVSAATATLSFPALTLTRTDGTSVGLRWYARNTGVLFAGNPNTPGGLPMPAAEGTWEQMTTQRAPWGTGQQRMFSWARPGLAGDVPAFNWTGLNWGSLGNQPGCSVTLEVTSSAPPPAGGPLQGFDGTDWQAGALSGWSGSGWAPARVWTGATWV